MYRFADKFTFDHIKGFKDWWKQWAKNVPIDKSFEVQLDYLEEGRHKLKQLGEDLLFVRGLWSKYPYNKLDKKYKSPSYMMGRIKDLLKEADDYLSSAQNRLTFVHNVHTPGTYEYDADNGHRRKELEDYWVDKFHGEKTPEEILQHWQNLETEEGANNADRVVSRKLFRHLKSILDSLVDPELDFRAYDREFKIGDVTFVLQDIKNLYSFDEEYDRDILYDKVYAKLAKVTKEILERRGFGKLWYGVIYVRSELESVPIKYEKWSKDSSAAATYYSNTDSIMLYMTPDSTKKGLVEVLIHELGHRYWFKFMSRTQRIQFEAMFESGDIRPVSEYARVHAKEAFAELFAWYILEKDLDAEQKRMIDSILKKASLSYKDKIFSYIRNLADWDVLPLDNEAVYFLSSYKSYNAAENLLLNVINELDNHKDALGLDYGVLLSDRYFWDSSDIKISAYIEEYAGIYTVTIEIYL